MNNTALVGFLRGAGVAILFAICQYIATHIGDSGLVSDTIAGVISSAALAMEHVFTS